MNISNGTRGENGAEKFVFVFGGVGGLDALGNFLMPQAPILRSEAPTKFVRHNR
jgi:hypothetical protein